jgi:hypothetical protein
LPRIDNSPILRVRPQTLTDIRGCFDSIIYGRSIRTFRDILVHRMDNLENHASGGLTSNVLYMQRNSNVATPLKRPTEFHKVWSEPRPVSLFSGVIRTNDAQIEEDQTPERDSGGTQRYPIKPRGYPDLPFPETPLVGAVLLVASYFASARGIRRGPFWLLMGGWLVGVAGGVSLLLWGLPYIAYWVAAAGALHS